MKPGPKGSNLVGKASRSRISALSKAKHAGVILSTIDQLRKRKVRPDLSRICHVVQRQRKLTPEQARAELDVLVSEKHVVKVDFKGSVSYRNAAKWRRQCHGKATGRTAAVGGSRRNKTGRRVLKAVKNLIRQLGNSSDKQEQLANKSPSSDVAASKEYGVTLHNIENWIREKWGADVADSMDAIKAAVTAEVNKGHLAELPDGSFTLNKQVSASGMEQPPKRGPGRPKSEEKLRSLSGKSFAVLESDTSVINSNSADDSSAVPVNPVKSSSQKKFGGKRKVHQSCFSVFFIELACLFVIPFFLLLKYTVM